MPSQLSPVATVPSPPLHPFTMERDLLFSYPSLDFFHAPDCLQTCGFIDFGSDLFSGSVLDTVSEDPIAELEDGDLFAALDSTGIPCETPLASQSDDQKGGLLSSNSDNEHNSDKLHSVPHTPLSNLNGFCNPSLNLGQVQQTKEVMPSIVEGGDGVSTLGSWRMNSNSLASVGTMMATQKLHSLTLDAQGEQKPYSLGAVSDSKLFSSAPAAISTPAQLSVLGQAAAAKSELAIPSFLLPRKNDLSSHSLEDPQDVITEASGSSSPSGLSVGSLRYELNAMETTLMEDESPTGFKDRLFKSPNLEKNPVSPLDFSEAFQRVDTEGDSLSPLPRPVQFSQSRMMQRSLSSHALGQLGTRMYMERPMEASLLTQTAPLYSSVKRLGTTPAQPQVQLADVGETTSRTAFNSMRRVFSTGDLQTLNGMQGVHEAGSPLHSDCTIPEERFFKVGRYTSEERKSRICRYRQKRTERNFSKKIKYACRKTLADSRPRVRGRFAKNEEADDILVRQNGSLHHDDEDEEIYMRPTRLSGYW